jgi:hypothetical protein
MKLDCKIKLYMKISACQPKINYMANSSGNGTYITLPDTLGGRSLLLSPADQTLQVTRG